MTPTSIPPLSHHHWLERTNTSGIDVACFMGKQSSRNLPEDTKSAALYGAEATAAPDFGTGAGGDATDGVWFIVPETQQTNDPDQSWYHESTMVDDAVTAAAPIRAGLGKISSHRNVAVRVVLV
ncbi:hypothetical protein PG985_016337 [Apiospora marii]|uniref:uncharacterized protein n=1 Tax=Apiospora marii TaxID=335849 RepID=UPI0031328347